MYYEERIKKLNKEIKKNNHKIRNLKICNNIIGLAPGAILITFSTIFTYTHRDNNLARYLYVYELISSLILGALLSPCNDTKLDKKINKQKELIKKNINELHGYALLENEKRMKNGC